MSRAPLAFTAAALAACVGEPAAFDLHRLDPEDYRGPAVTAVDPPAGSHGVPVDYPVRITLSTPVREASVLGAVRVSGGAYFPYRAALEAGATLVFTGDWPPGQAVRFTVSAGLVDLRGAGLRDQDPHDKLPDTPFALVVTMGADRLADPPRALGFTPADGERRAEAGVEPRITFSKRMTEAAVFVAGADGEVPGRLHWDPGHTALRFVPHAPLRAGRTYAVTLERGRDAWGLALAAPVTVRFATAPAAGHVVINEVVTAPRRDWNDSALGLGVPFDMQPGEGDVTTGDEYVELYNAGPVTVDLTGYTLEQLDGTAQTHLIGGSPGVVERYVGASGDLEHFRPGDYLVIGNPVGDNLDTVTLVLRDAQGFEVDRVALGAGAPAGAGAGQPDEAVARLPNGADSDDDARDFGRAPGSPGSAN